MAEESGNGSGGVPPSYTELAIVSESSDTVAMPSGADANEKKRPDGGDGGSMTSSAKGASGVGDVGDARGTWSGKLDFFFCMLGGAVGLGNIWRFPYLCYKNGGGAFLIPYVLMGVVIGVPLFLMESAFGQFSSLGPIKIWRISPILKGVGYAMVTILWSIGTYYNVTLAQIMYYLFASMAAEVPWKDCTNYWNTPSCYCSTCPKPANQTVVIPPNPQTPAEEYFQNRVIQLSSGIDNLGAIQWELCLCLLLVWIIVAAVLIRGAASLGKVVYFTALFPYVMMTIMLVQSVQLPGADIGLLFFITPVWERLLEPRVWADAASQMFFSISTCDGGLIAMSSYNQFRNNVFRDSILIVLVDLCTSLFCGSVVFSILGYMTVLKNTTIDEVVQSGPGLAFEVYPEALATMEPAWLWSVLFFFMMAVLGFGTAFSISEGVMLALSDELQSIVRASKLRNVLFRLSVCAFTFLISLPMVTSGGMYVLTLIDSYIGTFPMLFTALFELLILQWIYGFERFALDVHFMVGIRPNLLVRLCWQLTSPLIIILILVMNFIDYEEVTYEGYVYPSWATAIGFVIMCAPLSCVPIYALYYFCYRAKAWLLLRETSRPMVGWGPAVREHYTEYVENLPAKFKKFQSDGTTAKLYYLAMVPQAEDGGAGAVFQLRNLDPDRERDAPVRVGIAAATDSDSDSDSDPGKGNGNSDAPQPVKSSHVSLPRGLMSSNVVAPM